ncbi:MAG: lipoyl(octanoyl) transferase [Bacteroidetes bacterium GWC2_33_15]|nr:MAG: lipoyl(octanoyl) transferase [Bacteroidetes bacterium GWA2_33_15]OFX51879.1 MAG: lipoyl(octanoyl) transferase [Bacteroidetes bacterium GWC2_33_15]OFX63447.1 MAG: lipoyl(octanoyl) transferase [Bacteroidetes bacterium GWB2_32_14]OFX67204.1 MAG: lipoyl(octanoyl) transferase [Bacteroidetes bacterium GWD2_33_33]HAN17071.1 lipoate--protein ligase [Bacteroidales bacterium]
MSLQVKFEDLGLIDYKKAWDYQEQIFAEYLQLKAINRDIPGEKQTEIEGKVIFCEHPHVYTLGKSGQQNNLLIADEFLRKINATYYKINRGGDITYHGPGQIVGYPIIDLERFNLQVKQYIANLEQSIILTLEQFGIKSERLTGATGVWLDTNIPGKTRKICAIGVKASRFITMHGFAFNVNTNLEYFNYINPCGFVDKGVTSMEKELGQKQDINQVKEILKKKMEEVFGMNF